MKRWLVNGLLMLTGAAVMLLPLSLALRNPRIQIALDRAFRRCTPAPGAWRDGLRLVLDGTPVEILPCAAFLYKDEPDAEFTNVIRYNNYGFHDTDWTLEPPPGVFRVLLIGDSFAQGNEVPLHEGFPTRLEQMLPADGRPVEVLNMGLQTLSTADELALYAVLGQQFHADLVLLAFYMGNDVWDSAFGSETVGSPPLVLDSSGAIVATEPLTDYAPDPAAFPDSPAYRWYAALHAAPRAGAPPFPDDYVSEEFKLYLPEDGAWADARRLTESLLAQFAALADAEGSDFAVVIVPDRRAVYRDYLAVTANLFPEYRAILDPVAPHNAYARYLDGLGVPVLNLQPPLAQHAANRPHEHLYFREDGHFNAAGHALAADLIAGWLRESRLIP
jgi:lysophospholipase L1-like esterase